MAGGYASSVNLSKTLAVSCDMNMCKRLGHNLRQLGEVGGVGSVDLADRTGLHRTYISCVERSGRNPTAAGLEKIAKALKIATATLLD